MTTVKQIERAWKRRKFERLFRTLAAFRPEATLSTAPDGGWATVAAAMAIIRLDELGQSHAAVSPLLIRAMLASQQTDGGWGDLVTTALCVRALLCGHGNGVAVERGLAYLANLQKAEGVWPNVPLRRMPEDAGVSALILYELGDQPAFHAAVRVDDALAWFMLNEPSLDAECQALWQRARLRCQMCGVAQSQVDWLAA